MRVLHAGRGHDGVDEGDRFGSLLPGHHFPTTDGRGVVVLVFARGISEVEDKRGCVVRCDCARYRFFPGALFVLSVSNTPPPFLISQGPHQELDEGGEGGLLEDKRLDVREEGVACAVPLVVRLLPALQVDRVLVLQASVGW